jgi:thioredoxin 1
MIQYLDKSNFDTTINTNDVVLVDFFRLVWALRPYTLPLEELAKEFDEVVISKINVDKNPELTALKVRSIPALLYFKNGEIVDTKRSTEQISNDQ